MLMCTNVVFLCEGLYVNKESLYSPELLQTTPFTAFNHYVIHYRFKNSAKKIKVRTKTSNQNEERERKN